MMQLPAHQSPTQQLDRSVGSQLAPDALHVAVHSCSSLHFVLQHSGCAPQLPPFGVSVQGGGASTGASVVDAASLPPAGPPDDEPLLDEALPVSCTDPLLLLGPASADVASDTVCGSSRPAITAHAASVSADPNAATRASDDDDLMT
jgi:hypothetical protein